MYTKYASTAMGLLMFKRLLLNGVRTFSSRIFKNKRYVTLGYAVVGGVSLGLLYYVDYGRLKQKSIIPNIQADSKV